MKKIAIFLILALALYASKQYLYPYVLKKRFFISGQVKISKSLKSHPIKPNSMLFIIVKNEWNSPIALENIINPVFPQKFELNPQNLIMPDLLSNSMFIEAYLTNKGLLGKLKPGDLKGELSSPVKIHSRDLEIILSK